MLFDTFTHYPILYFKDIQLNGESSWRRLPLPPPRNILNLFCNPQGNLYFIQQTLLERFLLERQSLSKETLEQQEIFQLIKNIVKNQVGENSYQFKIVLVHPQQNKAPEQVYISDIFLTESQKGL